MRKIILTAAVLVLSACGFQLKGAAAYDRLPYAEWHVNGGQLQEALEASLRRADGNPVSLPEAQATVAVNSIETQKDVLTITRAANINEYLLLLRVQAQAAAKDGKPLGEPMLVEVRRTMYYADSEMLGKAEEEAIIWQEMRKDAADQIIRRLAFLRAAD